MTDHTNLILRLKAGETGQEMDARIWCHLNGKRFKEVFERYDGATQCHYTEPPKRRLQVTRDGIPAYTTSLDAAIAHMVPEGWDWERDRTGAIVLFETTWPLDQTQGRAVSSIAPTAAGAMCEAGLKAKKHAQNT